MVAVIAARRGYKQTGRQPLCAACFDRETPLWKSKLFWLLMLLAIVAIILALVLWLGDCERKMGSTTIFIESNGTCQITNVTSTVNINVTKPVDLVFVYDRSGSMSEDNVATELEFMKTIVRPLRARASHTARCTPHAL